MTPNTTKRSPRGFTILEIIVAVMILGVVLVSIYGAQFGAANTAVFAKYTTQAIQLARCRMSEVELEIIINGGFELGDVETSGDCCEYMDGEPGTEPFNCRTELKIIELPDSTSMVSGGLLGDGDITNDGSMGGMGMGMDMMGGMLGGMTGGGGDGSDESGMGMGMMQTFMPMVSGLLREAIRRVTVVVEWEEGKQHREFSVHQYLVHPTQGPLQLMHQGMNAMEQGMNAQEASEGGAPPPLPGVGGGSAPSPFSFNPSGGSRR